MWKLNYRGLVVLRPVASLKTARGTGQEWARGTRLTLTRVAIKSPSLTLYIAARGSGERCKLAQQGLGRIPSHQQFWCILDWNGSIWRNIISSRPTVCSGMTRAFVMLDFQKVFPACSQGFHQWYISSNCVILERYIGFSGVAKMMRETVLDL